MNRLKICFYIILAITGCQEISEKDVKYVENPLLNPWPDYKLNEYSFSFLLNNGLIIIGSLDTSVKLYSFLPPIYNTYVISITYPYCQGYSSATKFNTRPLIISETCNYYDTWEFNDDGTLKFTCNLTGMLLQSFTAIEIPQGIFFIAHNYSTQDFEIWKIIITANTSCSWVLVQTFPTTLNYSNQIHISFLTPLPNWDFRIITLGMYATNSYLSCFVVADLQYDNINNNFITSIALVESTCANYYVRGIQPSYNNKFIFQSQGVNQIADIDAMLIYNPATPNNFNFVTLSIPNFLYNTPTIFVSDSLILTFFYPYFTLWQIDYTNPSSLVVQRFIDSSKTAQPLVQTVYNFLTDYTNDQVIAILINENDKLEIRTISISLQTCTGNQATDPTSLICNCLPLFFRRDLYPTRDCIDCLGSQFYKDSSNPPVCQCKGYYFDDGVSNSCTPCSPPCALCIYEATRCLTCLSRFYLEGITCLPCHYSCLACSGPSINDCILCDLQEARQIQLLSGQCECFDGFFDQGVSQCAICHYSCLTCNLPNSKTACLTCPSVANFRAITPVAGKCDCNDGFYDDGVSPMCQQCHYSCQTCSNRLKSNCLSCDINRGMRNLIISSTDNYCLCRSGYYDGDTAVCQSCHFTCIQCTGGLKTDCIQCDPSKNRIAQPSSENACNCQIGFYETSESATCLPCDITCYTCKGPLQSDCLSCEVQNFKRNLNATGSCVCLPGYTEKMDIGVCEQCDDSCNTCQGPLPTDCVSCDFKSFLTYDFSKGLCVCDSNSFLDEITGKCRQIQTNCDPTCRTCTGPSASQCTSCDLKNNARKLSNSRCVCAIDNMRESPSLLQSPACRCSSGKFFDPLQSECVNCNPACLECSGAGTNNCVSCPISAQTVINKETGTCDCRNDLYERHNNTCSKKMQPGGAQTIKIMDFGNSLMTWGTIAVLISNPSVFLKMVDALQNFYYILYFDIDYPLLLQQIFVNFGNFDFQIFKDTVVGNGQMNNMHSPFSFLYQGQGSLFFINCQSHLISMCILLFFYSLLQTLKYLTRNLANKVRGVILIAVQKFEFSLIIGSLYAGLNNICIFGFLQVLNPSIKHNQQIFSYLLAVIFSTFCSLTPIFTTYQTWNFWFLVQNGQYEEAEILKKRWGLLFEQYKDDDFKSKAFESIFVFQKVCMGLFIVVLNNHPGFGSMGMLIVNIQIFSLLSTLHPFRESWYNYLNMFTEFFFMLIHASIFALSLSELIPFDWNERIAWVIIASIFIILVALLLNILREYLAIAKKIKQLLNNENKQDQTEKTESEQSEQDVKGSNFSLMSFKSSNPESNQLNIKEFQFISHDITPTIHLKKSENLSIIQVPDQPHQSKYSIGTLPD